MSNPKELRKALRNVVQGLLPELLQKELGGQLYKNLAKDIQDRLDVIEKNIKDSLKTIDDRSKDIQSYIVRQVTTPTQPNKEVTVDEQKR